MLYGKKSRLQTKGYSEVPDMKVKYVKAPKIDTSIREIYVLVLKEGWRIRVTSKHEGVIFVEAYGKYQKIPFILYPDSRTIKRGNHGCSLQ